MKILAIDSSGLVASVAVVCDEDLLGEFTVNYKKTHSQTLLPMLDELAKMIELDLSSLDAIAVAGGPGSFTGLRIGSATVKGLALALSKPVVQVPTVDAIAYNLAGHRDLVCPLMDARRNQTYTGLYRFDGNEMEVIRAQCAVDIGEIVAEINHIGKPVVFLGDGVAVFRSYIGEQCCVSYTFAPPHANKQRAGALASLAMQYYIEGKAVTAEEHRPDYLRLSQAERGGWRRNMLKVRKMTEADLDQVAAIAADLFSQPWDRQGFAEALPLESACFLVAVKEDEVLGYLGLYTAADEGELINIAVRRQSQREGVADRLMQAMIAEGHAKGVRRFFLEVRVSNLAAIRLYEKYGFIRQGIRKHFYILPDEDAYIMNRVEELTDGLQEEIC